MDYDMPGKDGVTATQEIIKADPKIVVIGFSMHDEPTVEKAMLEAGAAAHISKKTSAVELLPTIRKFSSLHSQLITQIASLSLISRLRMKLVDDLGGIDRARKALQYLEELA